MSIQHFDTENEAMSVTTPLQRENRNERIRCLVAYWLLGLTNNYAYVVMLSAAHDILSTQWHHKSSVETDDLGNETNVMKCNKAGTAAILLADILPALFIKSISTFLPSYTHLRIAITVGLCGASFLITSFSSATWMSYLGVIAASLSSGLGEVTFLGYAAFFDKDVISTWSSGTGGAGLFGSMSYLALTQVGMTPRNTLLVMMFVPVLMAISFWIILVHPAGMQFVPFSCSASNPVVGISSRSMSEEEILTESRIKENNGRAFRLTFKEKFGIVKRMFFILMLPLAIVYLAEYFINQALMEILYFPNIWLTPAEQYRWYQADYQLGVLISRSSVNFLPIKRTWILSILQILNVVILLCEVFFRFIPSIWITLAFIFYEGLLGGSAYVNTFYRISHEMPEKEKEFALSVTTVSDSVGVATAGAIGVPSHNALCSLHYKTF